MSIDLAWANQRIAGFEKYVKQVQETKASEQKYKERYAAQLATQERESHAKNR